MQKRRKILIILAAALLPALPLLWSFPDLAADRLFFAETGYAAVFTKDNRLKGE